jgi:hypothetical protein
VKTAQQATWGGPPISPVVVGVVGAALLVAGLGLAATRHAWLVADLAALKAGTITLAQLP